MKSAGRHARHAMLNDILKRTFASVGTPSILEPVGLTRSDGKRADGVTLMPWSGGACLAWDATVVDALAPSYVQSSTSTPGSAAAGAEQRKNTKYAELVERGYDFQAFAFEAQGRAGPETEQFLHKLGKQLKRTLFDPKAYCYLRQRVSVALQMGNAASVMGTLPQESMTTL